MIRLIVNPTAGKGKALINAEQCRRYLEAEGVDYDCHTTLGPGDATDAAHAAVQAGASRVIVLGGDGTVGEAAKALAHTQTPLGIIPSGSGNDFVKPAGINIADPVEALKSALSVTPRPVDLGRVNGELFINVAGFGLDVNTLQEYNRMAWKGRGMLPYLAAVLGAVFKYPPFHADIVIDGEPMRRDLLLFSVANGQYFGGGMRVAPTAVIDDGLFHFCAVNSVGKLKALVSLPAFIKGSHIAFDFIRYGTCGEIAIRGEGLLVQLDGELRTLSNPVFTIDRAALLLLAP